MRDPNGLEYYRVTSDITSFFPRIRFERRNEAAAQRAAKSALGQSAEPHGDYETRDYQASAGRNNLANSYGSAGGSAGLKLPTIRRNRKRSPATQKRNDNRSGYALLKDDWERAAQNESIKECLD